MVAMSASIHNERSFDYLSTFGNATGQGSPSLEHFVPTRTYRRTSPTRGDAENVRHIFLNG